MRRELPPFKGFADDLTGACDLAGRLLPFAESGRIPVQTASETPELSNTASSAVPEQFSVMSTNTRNIGISEAVATIRNIPNKMFQNNRFYYIKIDSTLRGPFAEEFPEWFRHLDLRCLPVIPAAPDVGRTFENGVYRVHGKRIHDSEYDRGKMWKNGLSATITARSGLSAGILSVRQLRSAKRQQYWKQISSKHKIVLIESATLSDLQLAVNMLIHSGVNVICGSSAPAAFLPYKAFNKEYFPKYDSVLIICGSQNSISLKQVDYANSRGIPLCTASPDTLSTSEVCNADNLIIKSPPLESGLPLSTKFAETLAVTALKKFHEMRPQCVVLTGGDTGRAFLSALNVKHLKICKVLDSGISLATSDLYQCYFILKPGGFGDLSILYDICRDTRADAKQIAVAYDTCISSRGNL